MSGRGPAPKDADIKRRRNKDSTESVALTCDDALRGPELPQHSLGEAWHPRTVEWWQMWRESPQAQSWLPSDWDFLLETAYIHHEFYTAPSPKWATELRLRAAKFGATPEDRARLRMQIQQPGEEDKQQRNVSSKRAKELRRHMKASDAV